MVSNVAHHYDFRKIKDGLMKLVHMDDFNGILDTGQEEKLKAMKDRSKDGKGL